MSLKRKLTTLASVTLLTACSDSPTGNRIDESSSSWAKIESSSSNEQSSSSQKIDQSSNSIIPSSSSETKLSSSSLVFDPSSSSFKLSSSSEQELQSSSSPAVQLKEIGKAYAHCVQTPEDTIWGTYWSEKDFPIENGGTLFFRDENNEDLAKAHVQFSHQKAIHRLQKRQDKYQAYH
jgi:hypothetical protein